MAEKTVKLATFVWEGADKRGAKLKGQLQAANAAAAASRRSCRTSHNTTAWSRPTTLAVADPMPPAPPVITVTRVMASTVYGATAHPRAGCRAGAQQVLDGPIWPARCGTEQTGI